MQSGEPQSCFGAVTQSGGTSQPPLVLVLAPLFTAHFADPFRLGGMSLQKHNINKQNKEKLENVTHKLGTYASTENSVLFFTTARQGASLPGREYKQLMY